MYGLVPEHERSLEAREFGFGGEGERTRVESEVEALEGRREGNRKLMD